jgi:SET domain
VIFKLMASQVRLGKEGKPLLTIMATGTDRGTGVFADRAFQPLDLIFNVIQVLPAFAHINHSCRPNCVLFHEYVVADKYIKEGDELLIDYNQIPFSCQPLSFDCLCGNDNCRGHINL